MDACIGFYNRTAPGTYTLFRGSLMSGIHRMVLPFGRGIILFGTVAVLKRTSRGKHLLSGVMLVNGTQDIYAKMLTSQGEEFWSFGELQITDTEGPQQNPHAVYMGSDEWCIVWRDFRADTNKRGNAEIFVQRIYADGTILWQENGICLQAELYLNIGRGLGIFPDSEENLFIGWEASDRAIHVQKLSPGGAKLFGEESIVIASQTYECVFIPDGNDGMLLGWANFENSMHYLYVEKTGFERAKGCGDQEKIIPRSVHLSQHGRILRSVLMG